MKRPKLTKNKLPVFIDEIVEQLKQERHPDDLKAATGIYDIQSGTYNVDVNSDPSA